MNILITSPSLNLKNNVSGVAAVTAFIINSNKQHNYTHFEIGKRDHEKRDIKWLLKLIALYFKWFFKIINPKLDLIHFNFPIDKRSLIRDSPMILMSKLFGKKIIIHVHGGEYLLKEDIPSWAKKLITLVLAGNQPKVFLSPTEKDFAVKMYNCKNVFVLANAIDTAEAGNFERDYSTNMLNLLFIGRICEEKGLNYLYEAFATLKKENIHFNFYMAGKGPEDDFFVDKFQNLLNDNFIFKAVVAGEEKISLLKYCNVFLLPSFFEGLPIALLEGMSLGQVPIVTNVGSIEEVVKNNFNGLIIEAKSTQKIVEAIKTIYFNHSLIEELGKNAKHSILTNYNAVQFVNNLNTIYNYE